MSPEQMWGRALVCRVFGHRDVVRIPHREVCEQPWDEDHAAETRDLYGSICHYCHSDWL